MRTTTCSVLCNGSAMEVHSSAYEGQGERARPLLYMRRNKDSSASMASSVFLPMLFDESKTRRLPYGLTIKPRC